MYEVTTNNCKKGCYNEYRKQKHIIQVECETCGKIFGRILAKVKRKIPLIKKADLEYLKDIVIKQEYINSYFCLVKKASTKLSDGVEQRDAAIKVNGSGATCLVYDGVNLFFPTKKPFRDDNDNTKINPKILNYFKSEIEDANVKIEKNDVIIIGSGENYQRARLATLNAALTLF